MLFLCYHHVILPWWNCFNSSVPYANAILVLSTCNGIVSTALKLSLVCQYYSTVFQVLFCWNGSVLTLLEHCNGSVRAVLSLSSLLSAPVISTQVGSRLAGAPRKVKPLSQNSSRHFFVNFLPKVTIEDIFQNQNVLWEVDITFWTFT